MRKLVGKDNGDKWADEDESQRTPQHCADRCERLQNGLLRDHRPTHIGGTHGNADDSFIFIAGRHDRGSIPGGNDGFESIEVG